MAKVKGLFFTFSLFILSTVILTLAMLIFHNMEQSKERAIELGSLDRMYDLYTSIEQGFSDIFDKKSEIVININNSTISFREDLPNDNTNFKNVIQDYKEYIESNYANIKFNIDELIDKLPLVIGPYDVVYQHNSIGGNQIEVVSDHQDVDSYIISIITTEEISSNSCVWNVKKGDLIFNVQVVGSGGTCGDEKSIDPSQENIVNINSDHILINLNSNKLTITNNDVVIDVKTIISFKDSDEQIIVKHNDVVNMTFDELGISKSGSVRIL